MRVTDPKRLREQLEVLDKAEAPRVISILAETGALLEGHFQLQAGEHSEYFMRFAQIGWDAHRVEEVARMLVKQAPYASDAAGVLCPEASGLFLGSSVARVLGKPLLVTKIDARRHTLPELRSGTLADGASVVLVNDAVTSGNSLKRLLRLARERSWTVLGVLVFAVLERYQFDRFLSQEGLKGQALVAARWQLQSGLDPAACSLCREGRPLLLASEFN